MALRNPDNLTDGHYANASVDADGKPRPLEVGFFTFKPNQVRFISVREAVRSGNGFRLSRENKNLLGPYSTAEEALAALSGKAPAPKAAEKPKPEPKPEPVKAKEPDPEPVKFEEPVEEVKVTKDVAASDDLFGDEEVTDPGMSGKKKLKKKSSSKKK
jgi:hypothetical protein